MGEDSRNLDSMFDGLDDDLLGMDHDSEDDTDSIDGTDDDFADLSDLLGDSNDAEEDAKDSDADPFGDILGSEEAGGGEDKNGYFGINESDFGNIFGDDVPSTPEVSSGDNDTLGDIFGDTGTLVDNSDVTNGTPHKKLSEMSEEDIESLSLDELTRLQEEEGILDTDAPSDLDSPDDVELISVGQAVQDFDASLGADHDGSILDGDSLLMDNFDTVDKDRDFISNTGEIVVMDNNDNGDNFKFQYIDIENIAIVKRIRKNTTNVEDLVQSIKSTGLLEPLVVAPTQTEGVYVLLAGFRRIMACAKAGKRKIPCIINIKANVPEIPVLEALYNHSKQYTIKEIVDYIDYLEKQKGIMSASMIEYLLQLNSGDYTKLKDILNDNDDDIVDKLFNGIYTIEVAFKKLEQRRKKESAEEKENKKAAKVYEDEEESGASNIAGSGDEASDEGLSEDEIQGLAISAGDIDSTDDEDFNELVEEGANVEGFKPHKQDYKDRERLDPSLRRAVLARDNNTCQICKISGQEFTEVLDVHHIVEVYLGGSDDINNLITACTVCHKLIHLYGRGELQVRPEEELSESEKQRFKRIIKLGTVIRKGMAAKGMKKEQIKKLDGADTIGRTKPGTGQVAG